ncbi:hypothetical protein EJ04DRAFT_451171 [Polyplosphaeria fusca]|uniref:Kinetochore complex Sim4 subunit Fta1-domain-containing protein n=1 Tax=Polyplosphaeria fusca TaxID=682080 RepID=A0A9P4QHR1_9PLEO|nr:hypothetical protein EJ04DRAFT_451171 [Polyplosphaeria fusca]
MADIPVYPLFNNTYRLYRVSPLHHGGNPLLSERALRTHAKRLRDQLKGDNVRGVQVDFGTIEGAMPALGPLELCQWDMLGDEDAWIDRHRQLLDPDASQLSSVVAPDRARGIEISLEYDGKHEYNALLLRDPDSTRSPSGFTSLPLLMVKMPAPIRDVFLNYLRTSFDAHVTPLKLAPTFLTNTLEAFLRHLAAPTSTQSIPDVIRQLQLQLSFPAAAPYLRHIDVSISGLEIAEFVKRGKLLQRGTEAPFATSMQTYISRHLALDLSHVGSQISRIICNPFTIQTDRIKIMNPDITVDASFSDESNAPDGSSSQLAVQELYASLVKEATGSGRFLPVSALENREETPLSNSSAGRRGRKRAISNPTPGAAVAKRTKQKGKQRGRRAQTENVDYDVHMEDA